MQFIIKQYGFRRVLPVMMICWSLVSWTQAWMTSRATFYLTRALIGFFEGGFIPGTILFATYFYKTRELSVRLAFFWSTLNVRVAPNLLYRLSLPTKQDLTLHFPDRSRVSSLRFSLQASSRCAESTARPAGSGSS